MRRAHFIGILGLLLVFGIGGGCGPGASTPLSKEESEQIRESKKKAHQQLRKQVEASKEGMDGPAPARKGAQRGAM
jgi:hypothetical protein